MIIHCTKKLAARLPAVSASPLPETSPLGSWHAHLFHLDRRQCVLFCHDKTRFVLFRAGVKKADLEDMDYWFIDLFANVLFKSGVPHELIEPTPELIDGLYFDSCTNRSVLGTLNVAKGYDLEGYLHRFPNVMDLPIYSTSAFLNDRPVHIKGVKGCIWPADAMRKHLARVVGRLAECR